MEKELKHINKKLDLLLELLGAQSVKLDEVKKIREGKPVFNPMRGGKKVK